MVDKVLEKTELAGYFESKHRVTAEDEPFDDYRGYMLVSEGEKGERGRGEDRAPKQQYVAVRCCLRTGASEEYAGSAGVG